jgi:hypothetical protein
MGQGKGERKKKELVDIGKKIRKINKQKKQAKQSWLTTVRVT